MIRVVVTVTTLDHGVHSGMFGGAVPDALTALIRVLASLHDDDGNVASLRLVEVDAKFQPVEGTERDIPAQLVLLAMGFTGPERARPEGPGLIDQLGVDLDERGNVKRDASYAASVPRGCPPSSPVPGRPCWPSAPPTPPPSSPAAPRAGRVTTCTSSPTARSC